MRVFTAIFVFSARSSMSYPLVWVGATVRRFNCYTRLPNNKRERQVLIKYEVSTRKDRIEMSCQNRVELGGMCVGVLMFKILHHIKDEGLSYRVSCKLSCLEPSMTFKHAIAVEDE